MQAAFAVLLLASTCSNAPRPDVGGTVGFDSFRASEANGPLRPRSPALICGSSTAQFGTELTQVASPADARVHFEWAPIDPGHDQMYLAGSAREFQPSRGDLTFDHPFGTDVTMDVTPGAAYAGLARRLGSGGDGTPKGTVHIELERGLFPHAAIAPEAFLPGFLPRDGDQAAVFGPWIIDCGHSDYHSEIHPWTFVAFSRRSGNAIVSHAFYNPYRETQLYNPDPTLAPRVDDTARFADPGTSPLPNYLFTEILRVGHVIRPFHRRLEAHILLEANHARVQPWFVCAPRSGGSIDYSYQFTVRPGVTITPHVVKGTGCVRFAMAFSSSYSPVQPLRKDCVDPWSELNAQAQAALENSKVDIRTLLDSKVPRSFRAGIDRDPIVDCYDPLVVPPPGTGKASGRAVVVSPMQPFPFYGWARVSTSG